MPSGPGPADGGADSDDDIDVGPEQSWTLSSSAITWSCHAPYLRCELRSLHTMPHNCLFFYSRLLRVHGLGFAFQVRHPAGPKH